MKVRRSSAMLFARHSVLSALLALAAVSSTAGCFTSYRVLTPAEVQARGTGVYSNTTVPKAVEAVASALTTLGYKVTVKDADTGVVKTAPREIMVTATGTATHRQGILSNKTEVEAQQTKDELAWRVTVRAEGTSVRVVAEPRGFRNGSELTDQENLWAAEVMDPKFRDLSREIGDVLGAKAP